MRALTVTAGCGKGNRAHCPVTPALVTALRTVSTAAGVMSILTRRPRCGGHDLGQWSLGSGRLTQSTALVPVSSVTRDLTTDACCGKRNQGHVTLSTAVTRCQWLRAKLLRYQAQPRQQLKSKGLPEQEWEDPSARARDENGGSHPRFSGPVPISQCSLSLYWLRMGLGHDHVAEDPV